MHVALLLTRNGEYDSVPSDRSQTFVKTVTRNNKACPAHFETQFALTSLRASWYFWWRFRCVLESPALQNR